MSAAHNMLASFPDLIPSLCMQNKVLNRSAMPYMLCVLLCSENQWLMHAWSKLLNHQLGIKECWYISRLIWWKATKIKCFTLLLRIIGWIVADLQHWSSHHSWSGTLFHYMVHWQYGWLSIWKIYLTTLLKQNMIVSCKFH